MMTIFKLATIFEKKIKSCFELNFLMRQFTKDRHLTAIMHKDIKNLLKKLMYSIPSQFISPSREIDNISFYFYKQKQSFINHITQP